MPNVNNLVTQHNSKITSNDQDKIQRSCNSRIKKRCPLNGKCLQQYMIYKVEVTTNTTYMGILWNVRRGPQIKIIIIICNISNAYSLLKLSIKSYVSWYKYGKKVWFVSHRKNDYCFSRAKRFYWTKQLISNSCHKSKFILNSVKEKSSELIR